MVIVSSITGERITSSSITVESDYLDRERRENALEEGYDVYPLREDSKGDIEKRIWQDQKMMEQLEAERTGGELQRTRVERSWPERESRGVWYPMQKKEIIVEL